MSAVPVRRLVLAVAAVLVVTACGSSGPTPSSFVAAPSPALGSKAPDSAVPSAAGSAGPTTAVASPSDTPVASPSDRPTAPQPPPSSAPSPAVSALASATAHPSASSATASPVPTHRPTSPPTATLRPTPPATPTPALTPPPPTPSPTPLPTPTPTPAGPVTRVLAVNVQQPSVVDVPTPDTLTNQGNGGIVVTTSRNAGHPLHMEWNLDPSALPAGGTISSVDTRVCGHGSGDFYEVYGPFDADPIEYEAKPPGLDGCWHFTGGPSDFHVTIYAYDDSSLAIDRIEFVVTSDR